MSTQAAETTETFRITPSHPRKLFVNLPVRDIKRTAAFFRALGFDFNGQFRDETSECMLVGEDAYFMLLERPKFESFTKRAVGDPAAATTGIFALTAESRAEVDSLYEKAIAAGGSPAMEPQDHGFMYVRSFHDLDGHHWELFWMDPAAVQG